MHEVYMGLMIALMIVMALLAIALIVIVMLQSGNQSNLGSITGAAETFFGKSEDDGIQIQALDGRDSHFDAGVLDIVLCLLSSGQVDLGSQDPIVSLNGYIYYSHLFFYMV